MAPVFEELLVTPQQIVQVGSVEVSESAPENDEMTRSNRADRIKLEATHVSCHSQNVMGVRFAGPLSSEMLFGNRETSSVLWRRCMFLGHERDLYLSVS